PPSAGAAPWAARSRPAAARTLRTLRTRRPPRPLAPGTGADTVDAPAPHGPARAPGGPAPTGQRSSSGRVTGPVIPGSPGGPDFTRPWSGAPGRRAGAACPGPDRAGWRHGSAYLHRAPAGGHLRHLA